MYKRENVKAVLLSPIQIDHKIHKNYTLQIEKTAIPQFIITQSGEKVRIKFLHIENKY